MAKFAYYVTNTFDGKIEGTDDRAVAQSFAEAEEFFVVEAATGTWLLPDGDTQDVEPIQTSEG